MTPIRKVLLVAPDVNLPLAGAQVQEIIRSGLDVTPVLGSVTLTDVTREIGRAQYDALWIAAHGNESGILLSDGIVESATLTQLVRGQFKLVVINSCSSLQPALMLQNEAGCDVVCTQIALPDVTAYVTAARFARELAKHGDARRAYAAARPGANRTYLYLAGMASDFLAET